MQRKKISLIFLAVVLVGFMFSIKETRTAHAFPACSGKACAVIEVNSGKILYEKNADARLPMASTTKIATAITVIENCDISMTVKVPQEAQGVEGSSIYLKAGETLTVKELLYGLMLQSGNDSAVALAVAVGGSVENFAEMMNKTARKCGAENTHFVNPHGLHDDKHYTTAHDLALISVHAMKNPEFRNIVSAKSAEISNEGTGHNRIIYNKNKLLKNLDGATGVKTGYTKAAGRCFVGSAKKGNMELICVLLNCGPMFEECKEILQYGLSHYTITDIVVKNELVGYFRPVNSDKYYVAAASEGFSNITQADEKEEIRKEVVFYDNIAVPLKSGSVVGILKVYREKELLFSTKLYNIEDIK